MRAFVLLCRIVEPILLLMLWPFCATTLSGSIFSVCSTMHLLSGTLCFVFDTGGEVTLNSAIEDPDFKVVAVPLEHGFDFDAFIDSSVEALVSDVLSGPQLFPYLRALTIYNNHPEILMNSASKVAHSSHKDGNPTSQLSAVGECCVARYYRDDYEVVLPKLVENACYGMFAKECRLALQSQIDRRQRYVNGEVDQCTDLV